MAGGAGAAAAIASDAAPASSMTNVYAFAIVLVIETLEWLGIIPDPIKVLEGYLIGRPRASATIDTINFLQHHVNPAGRLWGVQLSRMFTDDNIVISDSDPAAQKMLGLARSQFIKSAILQGLTNTRAQEIAQLIMTPAAQEQPIKIDFLTQAAPDGFVFQAVGKLASLYSQYLQAHPFTIGTNNTLTPEQKAEQYVYKHGDISDLNNSWIGPQLPDSYTPTGPIITGQNPCGASYSYDPTANICWLTNKLPNNMITQTCDAGYKYNPTSFLCEWIPTGQQTGTGNGGQPGGGQPGGGTPPPTGTIPMPPGETQGGDELNDCCNLSATYLYYVATAIQNLATQYGTNSGGQNSTAVSACCTKLTAQLQAIAGAIAGLPSALGLGVGSGPAPVDLSLIVAALANLDADLKAGNANTYAGAAEISSAIANVGSAIASAPPTDTTPLVNALTKLTAMFDIQQSTIDDLAAKGYIAPGDVQFYQGLPGVDGFFHKAYTEFHDLVRGMVMGGAGIDPDTGDTGLATNTQFLTWLTKLIGTTLKAEDAIVSPVLDPLIAAITKQLTPAGGTTYGNVGVDPDVPVKTSFGVAITATFLSALLSYFGIDLGEPVTRIAELIGAAIGIEELKDVTLGPLIREGIAKQATHNAKSIFRQDAPGYEGLAHLAARGHITVTRAAALAPLSGIPAEFVTPLQNAAYSNIGERTLIRLIETNLFSTADLTAVLTEHGMNARDQARTQLAAPFLATVSQRNALQAAVEKQFVEGLIDAPTLTSELESLQQNSDYINLIQTRCQIDQQIAIAKELANSYTILALTGTVDLNLYATQLEGLGYQPIAVNAMVAVVESKLTATNLRQAAAAERALERATVNIERRAALKNYSNGVIDSAGLAIALIATGLTSIQAAAWVDLAVLRKDGSPRLTYGLLKSPPDAQLLRARVTSLTDQRKKQLISDLLYIQALQALGIPQNWINALRAAADAESTPASANEFVPVTTG